MNSELFLAGLWLGLVQTGLSYALLCGAGAAPLLVFALFGAWIFGGTLGALMNGRAERSALAAAGAAAAAAAALLWLRPFFPGAWLFALGAAVFCGVFGGILIVSRARRGGNVGKTLLMENNGFTIGLVLGLAALYADPALLAGAAVLLWMGLLINFGRKQSG